MPALVDEPVWVAAPVVVEDASAIDDVPAVAGAPVAAAVEPEPQLDPEPEIDIEALLRLEAELEGDGDVAPSLVVAEAAVVAEPAFEPDPEPEPAPASESPLPPEMEGAPASDTGPELEAVALVDAPPDVVAEALSDVVAPAHEEPSLEAIAQERVDLERQFAELLDSVAPADEGPADEEPVALVPPRPETSEPLVDVRVMWSSMPATDIVDDTVGESAGQTGEDILTSEDGTEPLIEPLVQPLVETFGQIDASVEPVESTEASVETSGWWREALPWRTDVADATAVSTESMVAPTPVFEEAVAIEPVPAFDEVVAVESVSAIEALPLVEPEPEPDVVAEIDEEPFELLAAAVVEPSDELVGAEVADVEAAILDTNTLALPFEAVEERVDDAVDTYQAFTDVALEAAAEDIGLGTEDGAFAVLPVEEPSFSLLTLDGQPVAEGIATDIHDVVSEFVIPDEPGADLSAAASCAEVDAAGLQMEGESVLARFAEAPCVEVEVRAEEPSVAAGTTKRRKKRSRRKKSGTATAPVAPAPATAVVQPADPIPEPVCEVEPAYEPEPEAGPDAPADLPAATPREMATSLLHREVPAWTPPTVDVRPPAPEAPREPVPAPHPQAAPAAWDAPAAVAASDAFRPYEPEIHAVGLPDPEALDARTGRPAVTSVADALAPTPGSRAANVETWAVANTPVSAPRVNWRRVIAASILVALFQGAAFAAWWWTLPGATGTLVVQTSRAAGVEVILDDKPLGRTPFSGEVAPGRHKLVLRQGETLREMPVEISVGVVTTQAIDWPVAAGGRGSLQITSSPTGAQVLVGGRSRGETPLLLEDLPAGGQSLLIRSDAGTVSASAIVIAGATTPLDVKIFAGWILVDAPVEVQLLLNGREKIGSSMDGQILLPPGTHRVQATNDALGIHEWITATVEPGAVRRVTLMVAPATIALRDEAEVFVDGASIGTTPGTLDVPVGTHEIAIRPVTGPERKQAMTVRSRQRIEF